MPKLTDAELGALLRETFVSKQDLVEHLPEATKRRNAVLPLLAAAAVLVVLAGVLYGVQSAGQPEPAPSVSDAAAPVTTVDGDIWGAAIAMAARRFQSGGVKWEAVQVSEQVSGQVSGQVAEQSSGRFNATPAPGETLTALDKRRIAQVVTPVAPVRFTASVSPSVCAPGRVPSVIVGPIIDKGDHREVRVTFVLGCGVSRGGTYLLRNSNGSWKVIGEPDEPQLPATCLMDGQTGASPGSGC